MGNAPAIGADRHDAEVDAHLQAGFDSLVNYAAEQEYINALTLIIPYEVDSLLYRRRREGQDDHAANIAGDERHAQSADFRVCHVALAGGTFIGVRVARVSDTLDDLGHEGGRDAVVERVAKLLLAA
jgi:hypothetical protein